MRIRMTESVEGKARYTIEYKDNDAGKVESYKTGSVSEYELLEILERLGFDALPEVEDDEDLITFLSNYDLDWDYDDSVILIRFYKDGELIYENSDFDSFEDESGDRDEDSIKITDRGIIKINKRCIEGATLLSKEEYKKYKKTIPYIDEQWWTRSENERYRGDVWGIDYEGQLDKFYMVNATRPVARPALILNLKSSNLDVGDKFEFGEHIFTILSNNLAICDDFIGRGCFRKDRDAKDANIYEKSDVKKIVDNWFNENI